MKQNWNIYKMAVVKVMLVAFITGFTTAQTSLNGITWDVLNATQKFLLVGGVLVAMATSIVAFLDRTMERIDKAQADILGADEPTPTPPILPVAQPTIKP